MGEWFLSSTILLVLVLTIRVVTKRWLPATVRYLLWSVVALRLLFPFFYPSDVLQIADVSEANKPTRISLALPDEMRQAVSEIEKEEASSEFVPEKEIIKPAAKEQTETTLPFLWKRLICILWLFGVALFLARIVWVNVRLYGVLCQKRKRLCYPNVPIPVYLVEELPTPFLFGFFRPAIYLNQFSMKPEDERYILCHELTHYRHKDHIWAVIRALCVAIHWFHPLVWLAAACSKRDAELACDEGTIRMLGGEQAVSYGEVLLRMSERMGERKRSRQNQMIISTETAFGETELKERIVRIKNRNKKSILLGSAVLLMVLTAVLLLFAKDQIVEPLHPEEILLSDKDGYAMDGIRLGDSYIKVKKRLEKTPQLQERVRLEEYESDYQDEKVIVSMVDFRCWAELEGMYSGGVHYTYLDRRFFGGKYELCFEDYGKAVEYLQVLDQILSERAAVVRRTRPGEERYSCNDSRDSVSVHTLGNGEYLYQYWGKDNDNIEVIVRKENIVIYGEGVMWDAGSFYIIYEAAKWDYWAWYSKLKASFSEADGSLEKARSPVLRYEEINMRYLDKEEQDNYLFSPKCRFLVQIDSDSWAETGIEDLLRYMETIPTSTKWEIGLNDQDEIEWMREKKQP
ncbi:MAG: M56 family metallopeptidase [Lachnospiraceae bacterium]|jgi:beta-lactamase regulating signal transducer with metallopeptidase domain|nr:M56 family metallopeptidase [Lachnospiraceae bacterium]MCX4315184.1 M56 family metallopeptidase [Lachnospiraceae bacterium]